MVNINTAIAEKPAEVTDFVTFAKELEKKNEQKKEIDKFKVGDFVTGKTNNGYVYLTKSTYCVITSIDYFKKTLTVRVLASTLSSVVDTIYTTFPSFLEPAPAYSEWRKEYKYMIIGDRLELWMDYEPVEGDLKKGEMITKENKTTAITTVTPATNKYLNFSSTPTYNGTKNKTVFPEFIKLCKLSEKKLKQFLSGQMKKLYGENCFIGDGYIFCKGEIPVLLTAHMDTVHKQTVKDFYEDVQTDTKGNTKHIIASPQGIGGDDRCGVYAILKILEAGYMPYVLFCEEEETGGKGSAKFCKHDLIKECLDLKFMIEIDRANSNDLVFYDNDNDDWIKWITETTGWKKAWGSFSDISHLSPATGVSSVNMSCGYYKPHTVSEYVIMEELLNTIETIEYVLDESEHVEQFEYLERKSYGYYGYGYNSYYNYGYNYSFANKNTSSVPYYDDDEDDYYWNMVNGEKISKNNSEKGIEVIDSTATGWILEITFINPETDCEETEVYKGNTKEECWYDFFTDHIYTCYADVLDYYVYPEA